MKQIPAFAVYLHLWESSSRLNGCCVLSANEDWSPAGICSDANSHRVDRFCDSLSIAASVITETEDHSLRTSTTSTTNSVGTHIVLCYYIRGSASL